MPMNKPPYSENKHKRVGTVFMSLMEELKLHGDAFPTLEMCDAKPGRLLGKRTGTKATYLGSQLGRNSGQVR